MPGFKLELVARLPGCKFLFEDFRIDLNIPICRQFKKLKDQKLALFTAQRAIRAMMIAKTWKWMQLWLLIKPHLKCTQFSKFKKQFEDQIAEAEANIGTAISECDAVVAKHGDMCAERDELLRVLKSGDSVVQEIIEKTKRLEAASADLQNQVKDTQKRIKAEEELRDSIVHVGEKVSQEANSLRSKISALENQCMKCEEDKTTKDNQIHSLREEVAHQEDMIAKLQKEKKSAGEGRQKTEEDIQAMEDRCNHLSKVKAKLEQSLDECEDALEKEKRGKSEIEN